MSCGSVRCADASGVEPMKVVGSELLIMTNQQILNGVSPDKKLTAVQKKRLTHEYQALDAGARYCLTQESLLL